MTFDEWWKKEYANYSEGYGVRDVWNAALEEAAKVCELPHWKPVVRTETKNRATQIRSLKTNTGCTL